MSKQDSYEVVARAYADGVRSLFVPSAPATRERSADRGPASCEGLAKKAEALIAHMPKAGREIWSAQRNSARFWHNTLWDIAHFCEELEKQSANKAVRDAAKGVRSALQSGSRQFVLADSHRGASVARCAGATIYLLPALMEVSPYYGDLKYAKEHRWLAMLKAYHAAE